MPVSPQLDLDNLLSSAASALLVAGVAVMVSRAVLSNPIPWEAKKPLIEKYGLWAVNIAEGVCPHNDVACVEREAKRLYETRILRRKM
jgi:hypothetical protein